VILFLLTFIASRTISIINFNPGTKVLTVSKKTSPSSKSDTLLYEEKEKEKEEENSDSAAHDLVAPLFIYKETVLFHPDTRTTQSYYAPRSCGDATDLPVYLAKRTLLI